jgi:hypothetical protein
MGLLKDSFGGLREYGFCIADQKKAHPFKFMDGFYTGAKLYDKAPDAHRRLRRTAPPGFLSSAPLPPPDNAVSSVSMIEAGSELLKLRVGKRIGLISINFAERIRRVEHISIVYS